MNLTVASLCSGVCHRTTSSEVDTMTQPFDSLTFNLKSLYSAGWGQWVDSNLFSRTIPPMPNSDNLKTRCFQDIFQPCHGCRGMGQSHWLGNLSGARYSCDGSPSSSAFHTASDVQDALFRGYGFSNLLLSKLDCWHKLPTALLITTTASQTFVQPCCPQVF